MTEQKEQAAHTPGPWYARADMVSIGDPAMAGLIEGVPYRPPLASSVPYPERQANARLIAAAPELLGVAVLLNYYRESLLSREYEPGSPAVTELLDQCRAAIAKATGSNVALPTPDRP